MATVSLTTINSGDEINAEPIANNFAAIQTELNGGLDNNNVKSGAAVDWAKISKVGSKTSDIANFNTLTTDTDGATVTFDLAVSNKHQVVLAGNRTLALSNPTTGQAFILRLVQDATGSRTVTWFSTIRWADGTAPTLTTTANKADVFGFICTGTGTYDGFIIGQNV